jgi:hypothetical protein
VTKLWLCCAAILIAAFTLSHNTPAFAVQKPPKTCGGQGLPPGAGGCRSSEFCQAPTGQCFIVAIGGGTCARALQSQCVAISKPVCGCDGKTYLNDCVRLKAKVSKLKESAC